MIGYNRIGGSSRYAERQPGRKMAVDGEDEASSACRVLEAGPSRSSSSSHIRSIFLFTHQPTSFLLPPSTFSPRSTLTEKAHFPAARSARTLDRVLHSYLRDVVQLHFHAQGVARRIWEGIWRCLGDASVLSSLADAAHSLILLEEHGKIIGPAVLESSETIHNA